MPSSSCSPRPKCISPPRSKNLNAGASNVPSSSIQKIEDDTKGRDILQIQEDHKGNWQEYSFQEVIDAVSVEAIVADVDTQYTEQLEEEYVGYKNQKVWTMVKQLQT